MKRNENRVPQFDEIIFENRNKEYGAYDLRKRYKSVTSLSILGALAFCTVLVILLFVVPEKGTASSGPPVIVIAQMDDFKPEVIKQPEIKPPAEPDHVKQNIAPEVVPDSVGITDFIPATDQIIQTTVDGDVNDTIVYIEQPEEIVPGEPKIFIIVEEMPEFPGGNSALLDFIQKNSVYPPEALSNNIQGRVVLQFVVNTDGSVGKIEVIKSIDPLLDKEAVRVVSTLPKFKPGRQSGVPVQVWFSVPVLFQIKNQ